MFSKRSLEGELLIDHRASPGLTPEELGGFGAVVVPAGEVFESTIVTCSHCQTTIVLNPDRTRERGWCAKCDRYLCDTCVYVMARTLVCRSAVRQLDEAFEQDERLGRHLFS